MGWYMNHSLKYILVAVSAALASSAQASSWDMALESTERAIARAEQSARKLPVAGEISSEYGMREHPLTEQFKKHQGIDIAAPEGTAFYAAAMGRVSFAGPAGSYGNMVELQHVDGTVSRYAHASALNVVAGQRIHKGEVLGLVGSTGAVTGAHLHYEMLVNGQYVDPAEHHHLVAAPAPSIPAAREDDSANDLILADLAEKFGEAVQLAKAQAPQQSEPLHVASQASDNEQSKWKAPVPAKLLVSRLVPFKMETQNHPLPQRISIESSGSQLAVETSDIRTSIKLHMANISKQIIAGDLS